jgi:hypothetical protein
MRRNTRYGILVKPKLPPNPICHLLYDKYKTTFSSQFLNKNLMLRSTYKGLSLYQAALAWEAAQVIRGLTQGQATGRGTLVKMKIDRYTCHIIDDKTA